MFRDSSALQMLGFDDRLPGYADSRRIDSPANFMLPHWWDRDRCLTVKRTSTCYVFTVSFHPRLMISSLAPVTLCLASEGGSNSDHLVRLDLLKIRPSKAVEGKASILGMKYFRLWRRVVPDILQLTCLCRSGGSPPHAAFKFKLLDNLDSAEFGCGRLGIIPTWEVAPSSQRLLDQSFPNGEHKCDLCHSKREEDVEIVAMGPKVVPLCPGSCGAGAIVAKRRGTGTRVNMFDTMMVAVVPTLRFTGV